MADYFSEYSSFVASKSLPSPAETPYETPGYIRSKRSSQASAGASREQSSSPPPLPPDAHEVSEKARDGRYSALDPRRFTPTLHASLVSEILNLRRELDSKNNLVENLEISLADAKTESEGLADMVLQHSRDARNARQQVQQIEKGTYDAVEDLIKERDGAFASLDDIKSKLDSAQKAVRRQDEDAERTQRIWESEKEGWESERRQLERRVHVTETRLRTMVDEIALQQSTVDQSQATAGAHEEIAFKDSALGRDSDVSSVRSASPAKHKRNLSNLSESARTLRSSFATRSLDTPEPQASATGYSLADELGIEEEDDYGIDEYGLPDEDLGMEYSERLRRSMESRQSQNGGDADAKAKRVLGIISGSTEVPLASPLLRESSQVPAETAETSVRGNQESNKPTIPSETVQYVDSGVQPSPPESPLYSTSQTATTTNTVPIIREPASISGDNRIAASNSYSSASTQTEAERAERQQKHQSRDSLSPPDHVPSIAIHPSSRPSSPRKYALPPGTKNAFTQTKLPWSSRDASMQTEEIRIDKRKVPAHLLPGFVRSNSAAKEAPRSRLSQRASAAGLANIVTTAPVVASAPSAPPLAQAYSSAERSPKKISRENSQKDLRNMPLRAIPLPRPVLSPSLPPTESVSEGPLNRSSQYGVTQATQTSKPLLPIDSQSEVSDYESAAGDFDGVDLAGSVPAIIKPPVGRFGLSDPPKVVPEDKEISPERRPDTADSFGAAPAPSISSSRANSALGHAKSTRLSSYRDPPPMSPSGASMASSSYSVQSAALPFPVPNRSSSRIVPGSYSEGSQSPTPHYNDVFGTNATRSAQSQIDKRSALRKVQSAAVMRQSSRRSPPRKGRRRRHSPDLTPVQSMLIESPGPVASLMPERNKDLPGNLTQDNVNRSEDSSRPPGTGASSAPRQSEETQIVDAIAATMVGEWMWKYVRRRKSFGVQEDFPVLPDGSVDTSVGSTRHRRWVWLSPYERTIMWDSKQPTSNSGLLGKKGRKLVIQSVMDVQDNLGFPKNPELRSAYHRSILILTPIRALKLTTVNAERHTFWMTALSFLAQSGRLPSHIEPMPPQARNIARGPPPIPSDEPPPIRRTRSPSFGRLTVRDSIRLAKGKRPELPISESQPLPSSHEPSIQRPSQQDDSAEFPAVPRLYDGTSRHQRKRSSTGPRVVTSLNGLRNTSSTAVSSGSSALHSSALQPPSSSGSFFRSTFVASNSSKSGSRHDSMASPNRPNFFEAVGNGVVRMDAFVDPSLRDGVLYVPAAQVAPEPRRPRNDSNFSRPSTDVRRAGAYDDPFRSFDFSASNEIAAR